jgi:hypothetical protein
MKKYMIADLIKDTTVYPKTVSFTMNASHGLFDGTFGLDHPNERMAGPAEIIATNIANTDLYDVTVRFARPYPGPYPYTMPYNVLLEWEKNSDSGSWYNNNIRGLYAPKKS